MPISEHLVHIDLRSCRVKKLTESFCHELVEAWICHKRIAFFTIQGTVFQFEHTDYVEMEGKALELVTDEIHDKIILQCLRVLRNNSARTTARPRSDTAQPRR